jgi:repressor LexA
MMHPAQLKIIKIAETQDITKIGYRKLGQMIGVSHPQLVKHHVNQLIKKGYIKIDKSLNIIDQFKLASETQVELVKIPVMGKANCGQASIIADNKIENYLTISPSLLKKKKNIFALQAVGDSMNKANIFGNNIEEGDFVLVDSEQKTPCNNDYVVSLIDGCANIKKFIYDIANSRVVLKSESDSEYNPIFIDSSVNYVISGKVVQVIKK